MVVESTDTHPTVEQPDDHSAGTSHRGKRGRRRRSEGNADQQHKPFLPEATDDNPRDLETLLSRVITGQLPAVVAAASLTTPEDRAEFAAGLLMAPHLGLVAEDGMWPEGTELFDALIGLHCFPDGDLARKVAEYIMRGARDKANLEARAKAEAAESDDDLGPDDRPDLPFGKRLGRRLAAEKDKLVAAAHRRKVRRSGMGENDVVPTPRLGLTSFRGHRDGRLLFALTPPRPVRQLVRTAAKERESVPAEALVAMDGYNRQLCGLYAEMVERLGPNGIEWAIVALGGRVVSPPRNPDVSLTKVATD